jgi:hypothetical protein
MKPDAKLAELTLVEMSTIRMQHGEPYITIWVMGPRGGHREVLRIDEAEAAKLVETLIGIRGSH